MQRKISYFIISIIGIFLLVGCGASSTTRVSTSPIQNTQSTIPEPYSKMIDQLNANDLDMAEKYADLVIKDFSDSDYVYNAQLTKSIIEASQLTVENLKFNFLTDGIQHKSSLNTKSDIEQLKKYLQTLVSNKNTLKSNFKYSAEFILNNYSNSDKIKIEFPKQPSTLIPPSASDYQGLSWFSKVGYPVPKESDFTNNQNENVVKAFYYLTSNGRFSYIEYFYLVSRQTDDKELRKELLNKVIELTENDQYNKTRILAQDALSKIN